MKIYGREYFVYIIKVFSQESYMEDFISGKLFLNEAGYFNKLDDSYRGDKYDSKIVEKDAIIYINREKFNPSLMTQGFVGDDKVPILCCTILNENALFIQDTKTLKLKKEVAKELSKFGEYGLLFYYGELKSNIDNVCKEKNILVDQDVVEYMDFNDPNKNYLKIYKGDMYKKYFVKDISYKYQNELRFIFLSYRKDKFIPLINDNENHYILQLPKLSYYKKFTMTEDVELLITKE